MKIESGSKSGSLRPADWFVLRMSSSPEASRKPTSTYSWTGASAPTRSR